MKILVLTNNDVGLYRFRKELLIELLRNNSVFVSLPEGDYVSLIENIGCSYIKTEFNRKGTNPIKDFKLLRDYIRIIKKIKPDIVLTYTIKPNVYGGLACSLAKVPYISTITGLGSAVENGGFISKVSLSLYKFGMKNVFKMFFQNEDNLNFMINNEVINREKSILVSGSGVNLEEYKLLEYPNDDTIDFVYIGRMMKEKGFDLYIKTAEIIRKKYPKSRFHVCGMYEENYKDLIENKHNDNTIIFHGNVKDMNNEIYKNIQCTIHPSYYAEGLSNVLLETCACGRAIITTDKAGCKEVVRNGYNGFSVEQNDLEDLINKVEKYICLSYEQRKQMGLNARRYVEENFDRKIVVNKYIEVIEECLNQ